MSSRPGFDNAGFAVGTVTGLRWWDLSAGTLRGARADWQPGENTAECLRYPWDLFERRSHATPDESCHCGFWAYWLKNDTHEVGGEHPVLGVIDGYGRTLIGDLGFRAAKARLVALCFMFKIMVPEKPAVSTQGLWTPPANMFRRGPQGMETYQAMTGRRPAPLVEDPDALMEAQNVVEATYDVPVYSSVKAMLMQHPTTTDYLPPPPPVYATARSFPIAAQSDINHAIKAAKRFQEN